MREIILDTETTGMDPAQGDRLVEIGCIEVLNFIPTGRHYHAYINPERDVPAGAVAVHGLTSEFLKDKPIFSQIYTDFLDFVSEAPLVIHNAEFDMKFINAELKRVGHKPIPDKRVTDTLLMARKKFPGSPASLDALCRRFNVDNSGRELHGALLDAQLLAEVYLEMMGGRQHGLGLAQDSPLKSAAGPDSVSVQAEVVRVYRAARAHSLTAEELTAHEAMLADIKDPIWVKR
ncbi:MAG: DNA polymerase III subunit epsilon [Micavibrio aeruginosavorus]|uniref:DNA polymerase III subunit epsilon n=1 Tax=Micavibrio aeruginosavorus TaxID=349221 RepID=A0A7T5R2L6_9BACT|nr:MAG: DNA polymerase III subunit epsilon [Micavibrio aeruginosavorus]